MSAVTEPPATCCWCSTAPLTVPAVAGPGRTATTSRACSGGPPQQPAAGEWVSDQPNDASAWLDEAGHPWLASDTRSAGVVGATLTKPWAKLAGRFSPLAPTRYSARLGWQVNRDRRGPDCDRGQLARCGARRPGDTVRRGQGAQVALQTMFMTRSWGSGTIEKAGQTPMTLRRWSS
jgi:hypothetical protein